MSAPRKPTVREAERLAIRLALFLHACAGFPSSNTFDGERVEGGEWLRDWLKRNEHWTGPWERIDAAMQVLRGAEKAQRSRVGKLGGLAKAKAHQRRRRARKAA